MGRSHQRYELAGVMHPDDTTESYEYEGNGNITRLTDRAGGTTTQSPPSLR